MPTAHGAPGLFLHCLLPDQFAVAFAGTAMGAGRSEVQYGM